MSRTNSSCEPARVFTPLVLPRRNIHSLDPSGCDCTPGAAAAYLDATLVRKDGSADVVTNAICVHEEEGGLLWKHLNWRTGDSSARRNRRLVVMFLTTIGNQAVIRR